MSCSQAASKASMACWAFIFGVSFLRDFWHPRFTNKSCAADSCAAQERGLELHSGGAARHGKNSCVQR